MRWVRRSSTASRPAHSASADLPVPALPPSDTMPTDSSSSRSRATRCSAERPRSPNTSRSPRTSWTLFCAFTRPSACELPASSRIPVWHGRSRAASRSTSPSANNVSMSSALVSSSVMPVQPDTTTSCAWYSSAARPTAPALTRSGMSLLTNVTRLPSAARLAAQHRMRESLVSVRKPAGSTAGSLWLSSTCSVPPCVPTGMGWSSRPCSMRRSSNKRNAWRANQPSSWWWRLASSSLITTSGTTTSCSAKREQAHGSDSRTDVSNT